MACETAWVTSVDQNPQSQIGSSRAWLIWILAAFVFFYAFIQRVAPGVMVDDLMSTFAIGAAVTGTLSALYFYPYVLLQIPLGALIQQIGPRALLTVSLIIAGFGSILFGTAEHIYMAYAGRILVGVGSAVGFLGSLSIASKWFPAHRFAFLSGLVMFFGMGGGVLGQGPLSALIEISGWRTSMWYLGIFSFILAGLIFFFVRNEPEGLEDTSAKKQDWKEIWRSLREAFGTFEVWKVAIVASTMSGPMLTFGGLWATPYLMQTYSMQSTKAASLVSLLFIGWAIGAPFFGWLSDRIQMRKKLLNIGSGILCVLVACICFIPNPPLIITVCILIGIGFTGAAMTVCFALARENTPANISGAVIGIVNSMTVASGAVLQPAVGVMLDNLWDGTQENGINVYQSGDYRTGFIVVLSAIIIGFLTSLSLRESVLMRKPN